MKWDLREPCGSCPYRRDAKLGLWHPSEFENLLEAEERPLGATFGCHGTIKHDEPSVCIGWLLDQKRRDLPSIALRIRLAESPAAVDCLKEASDGGHELYESIEEMVEANEALGRCRCGRYRSKEGPCVCGVRRR